MLNNHHPALALRRNGSIIQMGTQFYIQTPHKTALIFFQLQRQ
jgi:hypothetical protein